MSTSKKVNAGRSALGQCTLHSLYCNTGKQRSQAPVWETARAIKETSADFLTETLI